MSYSLKLSKLYILMVWMLLTGSGITFAQTSVANLMVEYTETPMGIDVEEPRFSWQISSADEIRGYSQSSYRIVVTDPAGNLAWDSGSVKDDESVGVMYQGEVLEPETRYNWQVTVWNNRNETSVGSSWFETGLMNPDPELSAWGGAQWIGGTDEDLVFNSHYFLIFKLEYTMKIEEASSKASFVYGANDSRLMDMHKNIYQVENGMDESYIKLELDISKVDGSPGGHARFNIYRAGYNNTDDPSVPFETIEIDPSVINASNKHDFHKFEINSTFGRISISINDNPQFSVVREEPAASGFGGRGTPGVNININPVGSGGNHIPFGMICEMGFASDPGQKAIFRDVRVRNHRFPNNTLFSEEIDQRQYDGIYAGRAGEGLTIGDGQYLIDGGTGGVFVVADPSRNSNPMLRNKFRTRNSEIERARLYIAVRGMYEMYINGERVGEDYYNPGQTQYNKTHFYQTYDVTDMVSANSENAIGAWLGEGWWSGLLSFGSIWNHFGDRQSLLAKLVITYQDGTSEIVTTNDKSWKYYNEGPVLYGSLNVGEIYDATRDAAVEGWSAAGYDDSGWKPASVVPLDQSTAFIGSYTDQAGEINMLDFSEMKLVGQIGNNAGIFEVLEAKSMEEVRPGVFVYNMGQNIVGVPRITIANGREGQILTTRVSEMLYPELEQYGRNNGMIMTENYRAAMSQNKYTMKNGHQVYQPRFTSHGYQYIEITGIDEPLPLDAVQGLAMSSVRELTADYKTSNQRVNQLWSNLVWSNIDNFLTLPTDCPQRNERMGWGGDINVFARTATYVSNSNQFLARHMVAKRDVQTEEGRFTDIAPIGGGFGGLLWGSAGITIPWEVYLQYNDIGILADNYEAMVDYIEYLETTKHETTGLITDNRLGDWLGPQNNQLGTDYLVTAYHVHILRIMADVAAILGKQEDAGKFSQMHKNRKTFFNDTFVSEDLRTLAIPSRRGTVTDNPEFKVTDTQSSYAVGLALNAFNEEYIPAMAENLSRSVSGELIDDNGTLRPPWSLMTGFIGTSWISVALSEQGLSEHAYRLLQNDSYPSWLYPIDQGATTIWERLNGYTIEDGFGGNNGMNSFNHYSFGAVGQWMIAYSLGIQRDEPGFKRFILQPEPDPTGEMTWANGHYDSMYGRIESGWKTTDNTLIYNASVPANTSATLYLPTPSPDSVTENGMPVSQVEGISFIGFKEGKAVYHLVSGEYEFTVKL